ncbi:cytochrome P450 [Aspergillus bertholletiae]|uniref:Cytochrome P450 n=1 Tax=Aspergillus bertholletiae TaxID=1226010 RepID=A0A5N7BLR1_9EURO|nr:cytochrome P450 [Aspergillus bertholletiae]
MSDAPATLMETWLIPGLLAAIISVRLLCSFYAAWRHAHKAGGLNCQKAPLYPTRDPFGLFTLFEALRADREKVLPELSQKRVDLMSKRHNRYVSTFRVLQAGRENFFTADPKNIQAMLATQFNDFGIGDMRRNAAATMIHRGIFISDGPDWSHSRSLLRPQFTRTQINNLQLEERHIQNAFRAMPTQPNGWTSNVDIQSIFFRLTLDSATEFLFGKSCHSQLTALGEGRAKVEDSFLTSFDRCSWYLAARLRFERLYWLVNNPEFQKSVRVVHDLVDGYVHSALQRAQQTEKPTDPESPSHYILLDALTETTRDPIELRDQCLNVLLAGRDTTASLLSWSVLILARHPQIFRRLRKEIIDHFGTYDEPRDINFSSLKSCRYLQHFINETLRLHPVVPFNRRCANKDTTLPTGGGKDGNSPIYLQKGQQVLFSSYVLQRRKDIWGEDAEEFNPERWFGRKVLWEHIPFSGGPRTCIGQQFALVNASYTLVRLLQRFDSIEDVYPDRQIRYGVTLTSCPADRVTVRMHEAEI